MMARETNGGLIRMGVFAFALATVGNGVWAALVATNLRLSPRVPWSVPAMAVILWLAWAYLSGARGNRGKAALRHARLRAIAVSHSVWKWVAVAGALSIISLAGVWIVLEQLLPAKGNVLPDFSRYPVLVVALILIMASLTGAAVEEAAFRGYFQGALETRLGAWAAILITALVMLPAHGLTQGFGLSTIMFYLCVDGMLGVVAYLAQSIVPGVVVHAAGLLVFFSMVWPFDAGRRSVRSAGADGWFWAHVAQAVVGIVLSVLAYQRLALVASPVEHPT